MGMNTKSSHPTAIFAQYFHAIYISKVICTSFGTERALQNDVLFAKTEHFELNMLENVFLLHCKGCLWASQASVRPLSLRPRHVFINNSMRHRWNFANKASFWSSQWALQNDALVTYFTATVQKLLSCEVSTFDEARSWTLSLWLDPAEPAGRMSSAARNLPLSLPKTAFPTSERTFEIFFKNFGRRLLKIKTFTIDINIFQMLSRRIKWVFLIIFNQKS